MKNFKITWKTILLILTILLMPAFYEGLIVGKESLSESTFFTQVCTIAFSALLVVLVIVSMYKAMRNTINNLKK